MVGSHGYIEHVIGSHGYIDNVVSMNSFILDAPTTCGPYQAVSCVSPCTDSLSHVPISIVITVYPCNDLEHLSQPFVYTSCVH